jgi:molybdopterin-guanine dinucleotide biosynthesis protein A
MNHGDCEHLRFAAAVLAGGGATRLGGRDKALLTLPDGRPLLAKLLTEIRAAGIAETLAVTAQPEAHAGFGAAVATDLRPGMGPLGGIETALAHFDGRCDAVLLLPCDLPALTAREMTALLRAFAAGGAPVVFAVTGSGDRHPLCAVARPAVLSAVSAARTRWGQSTSVTWACCSSRRPRPCTPRPGRCRRRSAAG